MEGQVGGGSGGSSGGSGGKGRGTRIRTRRATEAHLAASIGLTALPREEIDPRNILQSELEQLTMTQQARDLVGHMAGAGPRHQGARLAGAMGGHAGRVISTRGFRMDKYDIIYSKPEGTIKQGKHGDVVQLLSNYFALKKECDWCLYTHSVQFSIDIDSIGFRKRIINSHKEEIGCFLYDGTTLYSNKELSLVFKVRDELRNSEIIATIKLVNKLIPGDIMYMQFYNTILRKCLFGLELNQMGRNFYNPSKGIKFNQFKLELWPGYITAISSHEKEVLLCVEVTHKVVRSDTCLDVLRKLQGGPGDFKESAATALVGSIVLTNYNNKTYRVDDIDWIRNPRCTFDQKGVPVTFVDYFSKRYNKIITDFAQPLLVAKIRQKDLHGGTKEQAEKVVLLVPELCQMTGLTDDMRANFTLMKALSEHLHMVPPKRIEAIKSFMRDLQSKPALTKELTGWGLEFANDLTKCQGRILPKEGIVFAGSGAPERPNEKADWTMAFRKRQMLKCINLERWAILVPQRDAQNIDNLVKVMIQVARPLGLNIRPPLDIIKIPDGRSGSYLSAVDAATSKNNLQLLFVVLPNNKLDLYSVVKKRLSVNMGLPSQCFLAKNLTNKGLMSIATKVVIQINAKLGGEPWSVQIPLKNCMVVGFDAYRGGGATKIGERAAIGAMVATVNSSFSRYFSTISNHKGEGELGNNLAMDMNKCVDAYLAENGSLPDRIIVYRDGVGDGQLRYVHDIETKHIRDSLEKYYANAGVPKPKLTYIVVTKRINTRIFNTNSNENPPPGTIVDDTITLPERYDFYLVSAAARQGTVSPCSYNVLVESGDLDADKIQRLTYKMCHMYYNWSGTVAVPAPCQYAHKLAFLAGMALGAAPADTLNNKLHFL